jgi:hypothetical protein
MIGSTRAKWLPKLMSEDTKNYLGESLGDVVVEKR